MDDQLVDLIAAWSGGRVLRFYLLLRRSTAGGIATASEGELGEGGVVPPLLLVMV